MLYALNFVFSILEVTSLSHSKGEPFYVVLHYILFQVSNYPILLIFAREKFFFFALRKNIAKINTRREKARESTEILKHAKYNFRLCKKTKHGLSAMSHRFFLGLIVIVHFLSSWSCFHSSSSGSQL